MIREMKERTWQKKRKNKPFPRDLWIIRSVHFFGDQKNTLILIFFFLTPSLPFPSLFSFLSLFLPLISPSSFGIGQSGFWLNNIFYSWWVVMGLIVCYSLFLPFCWKIWFSFGFWNVSVWFEDIGGWVPWKTLDLLWMEEIAEGYMENDGK